MKKLFESSKKVLLDCTLHNGAIVAANSNKEYFPKEAKGYRYVWPRDASYICMAAKILDINIFENFFEWCMKAEKWNETGLFFENYIPSGKHKRKHLQIDQTGTILIALHFCYEKLPKKFEKLVSKSANSICNLWEHTHFNAIIQDLWEERFSFPDIKENFTYSLAACSEGLLCASKFIHNRKWIEVSNEMRHMIKKQKFISRSFGDFGDNNIDASLASLVWPFNIFAINNKRMQKVLAEIEVKLAPKLGVHRYEGDSYDGWMYNKIHRKKGAGYWPLLNFWMTIVLADTNRPKAMNYYNKVLNDLKNKKTLFIPEQIFDNDFQKGVSPLAWSHAMFIIASQKLKLL